MRKYKVLKNVIYSTGEIGLDDKQARRRKRKLKPTSAKDVYEILAATTFKKGEVICLEKVSKYDEKRLECLDEEAPKRKRTPTKVKTFGKPAGRGKK